MTFMHMDFETSSACDLKTKGSYAYSRHPSTDILCAAYVVVDSPKLATDADSGGLKMRLMENPNNPERIMNTARDVLASGGKLCAVNAMFEYYIWNNVGVPKYNWIPTHIDDWLCIMQQGACANLPQNLAQLAARLKTPVQKQPVGKLLIGDFCIKDPEAKDKYLTSARKAFRRSGNGALVESYDVLDEEQKRAMLHSYCCDDVWSQMYAWAATPATTTKEHSYQVLTNRMNERGVRIDLNLVARLRELATARMSEIAEEIKSVTEGAVDNPRARKAPLEWVASQGVKIPKVLRENGTVSESLDRTAIERLLLRTDIPDNVRRFLGLRYQANKNSISKLDKLILATHTDGRYRGALVHAGAAQTTRWSSRGVQLQNIPRGVLKYSAGDYDLAIKLAKDRDAEGFELCWGADALMEVYSSLIRPCIIPDPDHEFIISDFSQIEPRVAFWLAGQNDLLEAFRQGQDLYAVIAAEAYRCSYEEAKNNPAIRQFGKIAVLAGNYRGGAATFRSFAFKFGILLSEEEAETMVQKYRDIIGHVVEYWQQLQQDAFAAVRHPGVVIQSGKLRLHSTTRCFRILLPSGRCLYYWRPRIEDVVAPWADVKPGEKPTKDDMIPALCYTNHKGRTHTHGGKLFENVVQAIARDPMAEAMVRLEDAGIPNVLTVHDETVCEVEKGSVEPEAVDGIMCVQPEWAPDLPLGTETDVAGYYHK